MSDADRLLAFAFLSALVIVPIAAIVFLTSLFHRRDRLNGLAALAVVVGFFVCGAIGWALVPPQWTASFLTTVDASMNAAKYGGAFEDNAEHALMYFFWPAILGAVVAAVASLVAVWVVPVAPSAKPVRWQQ